MTKPNETYRRLRDQLTDREQEILDARLATSTPAFEHALGLERTSKAPAPSAKDRTTWLMAAARENFAKHQIVKTNPGRWLVRQPGSSTFWFEVVVLAGGSMIVHGDVQAVIFGHYCPSRDDAPDAIAWQTVHWMASCRRPDDHYFVEKADIGGTAHETIWTYDSDTFRQQIRELIAEVSEGEVDEDGTVDAHKRVRREALEAALERVSVTSVGTMQQDICDALDGDSERIPSGEVISSAMIYAHAALQCLARLLDAEENGVRCG